MSAGYSFRPRLWALALAAAACAAGIALGNWQTRRAEEKRALRLALEEAVLAPAIEISAEKMDPVPLVYKKVSVRGQFVPKHTIFLDNKIRGSKLGYEVLTPLRIGGSKMHVLVNRGWIEREGRAKLRTPKGTLRVTGIAFERLPRLLELKEPPAGPVRQHLDIAEFAAETGLELQPIILQASFVPEDDQLLREWPPPDFGIDKHQSYALQWYGLAALAVVLAIVLSFRRAEKT